MNIVSIALSIVLVIVGFAASLKIVEPKSCYTIDRAASSHIRLNNCTGEAHVIVRGGNGFEWQVVR